jgi:hypothetical protein
MGHLKEKAAYIRGLADGMKMGDDTPEQCVLHALMALVEEMAGVVDDNQTAVEELTAELDRIEQEPQEQGGWTSFLGNSDYEYEEADAYVHCPRCGEAFAPDIYSVQRKEPQRCPHCGDRFLVEAIIDEE